MAGLGTIVNVILVLIGCSLGLVFKKLVSEKMKSTLIQALALCTMAIGLTGVVAGALSAAEGGELSSRFTMVMIMSMVFGTFVGEAIDIDDKLERFGAFLQRKFSSGNESSTFGQGFVTATLTFCVGSMAIVGSLNDGILHDPSVLYAKSALDGVISIVYASTLGIGVMFSIISVAIYQGGITLFASLLAPYLTETVITQMSLVGSLLIMGIGFNFIYQPKIKLANMLPAIFAPLVWYILQQLFGFIF